MSFCLPYMLLLQGRRRNWSQINNSPKLQIQIDLLFYLISGSDQSLWSLPGSRTEKTLAGYLLYIFVLCRSINLLTCRPESWAGDMSGLGQVSSRPGWRYIEQWEYVHLRSCHLYWITSCSVKTTFQRQIGRQGHRALWFSSFNSHLST